MNPTTLVIVFFGLCTFFGTGNDPRTVIAIDVSKGANVHGHKVQPHAAFIHVDSGFISAQNWKPKAGTPNDFALNGETLTLEGIDATHGLDVDGTTWCHLPHLEEECPSLSKVKPLGQLKTAAAANIELAHGHVCAYVNPKTEAVSGVYRVDTTGEVLLTATRGTTKRHLRLAPNAVIELRNEPIGEDELVKNHFIAYYDALSAAGTTCCTNLPFIRKKACLNNGCALPPSVTAPTISTVACSNSTYP